jgi:uncharacterized membrane protein
MTDAEVVALAAKHCIMCHAEADHEAFDKPPKGIRLETIGAVAALCQRSWNRPWSSG